MIELSVNVDHVATLRQARRAHEPSPLLAALLAEQAGAQCITVHLREDRRHIQDADLEQLRAAVTTTLNLEMSLAPQMVAIARRVRPHKVTLVPERREEVTTEGGLDLRRFRGRVAEVAKELAECGVAAGVFLDASREQVELIADCGLHHVELHTGVYAAARSEVERQRELAALRSAAAALAEQRVRVHAGHALNYASVIPLLRAVPQVQELAIGHAIVARALFVGWFAAVREMVELIRSAA